SSSLRGNPKQSWRGRVDCRGRAHSLAMTAKRIVYPTLLILQSYSPEVLQSARLQRAMPTHALRRTAYVGLSATLIATASIPVLPIVLPTREVQAAWYSEDWSYRKRIELNSPTDQQNVYYELTLDTSDSSKYLNDCSDLRFTKQN